MSPLPYRPEFPPRTEHRVIDRQGVGFVARCDGVCLGPESYDWRILFVGPETRAVGYVEPGTSLEH